MVSSSGCAARTSTRAFPIVSTYVAAGHLRTELREAPDLARRARVVRRVTEVLGSETEREGDVEGLQLAHLVVEPRVGIGAEAVRPAQAGAKMRDAELLQPADG